MKAFIGILLFLVFIPTIGCSTPYQRKNTWGNGYNDYALEPNIYFLSFEGNRWTNADTVSEYWHRRAAEICGGSGRYQVLGFGGYGGTAGPLFEEYHRREGRVHCK